MSHSEKLLSSRSEWHHHLLPVLHHGAENVVVHSSKPVVSRARQTHGAKGGRGKVALNGGDAQVSA